MSPKEIVRNAFEIGVAPWLETLGFTYSRSRFQFRRNAGEFEQLISVTKPRGLIAFSSWFQVKSPKFNRWLELQGRRAVDRYLWVCADWRIPGWSADTDRGFSFDIADPAGRQEVMAEWRKRCEITGMPYLARLCSFEAAANEYLRGSPTYFDFEMAADLWLFDGDVDRAIEALRMELASLDALDFSWTEKSHSIFIEKRNRQALERDSTRNAIAERLQRLLSGDPSCPPESSLQS